MTVDLVERRRVAIRRHNAFLALARAIVNDEIAEPVAEPAFSRRPIPIRQSRAA
jgi:hypothetical protein